MNLLDNRILKIKWEYLILLLGYCLAIYQFVFNRGLYIDEASLGLNLIHRDAIHLLKPLEYNQIAPIGFLMIERFFIILFGKHDYVLRIFPLLSFLFSLIIFYLLLEKNIENRMIRLISLLIFSSSVVLIRYATEIKQYSSDVFFTLLILYFTTSHKNFDRKYLVFYSFLGAISIWFSNVSIIILTTSGIYLIKKEFFDNKNYKILLPLGFWLLSFIIYYLLFIHNHPAKNTMLKFWSRSHAFLPGGICSNQFYTFLYDKLNNDITGFLLGFKKEKLLPTIILGVGIIYILKVRNFKILYFFFVTLIIHLILSSFKLYPFSTRLILYLFPFIIILFSIGIFYVYEIFKNRIVKIPSIIILFFTMFLIYCHVKTYFPIKKEEIKPCLTFMEKNISDNDKIYVYHGAVRAFRFYKETGFFQAKNLVTFGKRNKRNNNKYESELLSLKGRVWLLFSHDFIYKNESREEYMIKFLKNYSAVLVYSKKEHGSSIYCFDIK